MKEPNNNECPFCPDYIKTCEHFDEEGNLIEDYFGPVDWEYEEHVREEW